MPIMSENQKYCVVAENLGKVYNPSPKEGPGRNIEALKDVSFSLFKGQSLGIVGKNGSGKSTLLKLLSGVSEPGSGKAMVYGKMASVLEIGVGFHPDLSGKENVILNGQLFGHSKREIMEKLDEIIDFTEFGNFMDMPVKSYSSGMYTRYAFALTSHVEADIFLFDEVFAGGDAAFREKASARIRDLRTKGKSIIWTSHNIGEVLSLCDQMMLLKEGKMMAFGDPLTLVAEYMPSFRAKGSQAPSEVHSFVPVQENRTSKSILSQARIVADEKTDQPDFLEMEILCGTEAITAGFIMYTELNAPLTSSFTEVPGKSETGSTTVLRCRFPQDQLRNGQYKLALFIMKNNYLEEYYTHALVFNVQKDQYISKIDSILPGSVNLRADWQTINDI